MDLSVPFLGRIPIDPKIVETGDGGKPFVLEYSKSESAKVFGEIVDKVQRFVSKDNQIPKGEIIAKGTSLGTKT